HGIPADFDPLRYRPHQLFAGHPLTGEPFETNPGTGLPRSLAWREIWRETLRPRFAEWLKTRNR
ncbi:MAG: hypothetical protein GWO24_32555, partial [Akkermansiaceae bacterium]|nr:hypothetical protein [Akkermansiaceae bacterium]